MSGPPNERGRQLGTGDLVDHNSTEDLKTFQCSRRPARRQVPEWRRQRPRLEYRYPHCHPRPNDDDALAVRRDKDGLGATWKCFRCEHTGSERRLPCRRVGCNGTFVVVTVDGKRTSGCDQCSGFQIERSAARPVATSFGTAPGAIRQHLAEGERWQGSPVEGYLASRGLEPHLDSPLLFHSRLWHPESRRYWPGMIAPVTDIRTGELAGLHRTFLDTLGRKAPLAPQRKTLGSVKGGAVRLVPDDAVTLSIGAAEGIETALAATRLFSVPTWATICAGSLADFPVLPGIEALHLMVDHDEVGISAAEACAARWRAAGREVIEHIPDRPGTDWADVLARSTA